MPIQPSIFLSHGAPTLLLEDGPARRFLGRLADELPRPEAIVVASAHWEAAGPRVSAAAKPQTIYDFGGFPAELYDKVYPASGDPALARQTAELLRAARLPVDQSTPTAGWTTGPGCRCR